MELIIKHELSEDDVKVWNDYVLDDKSKIDYSIGNNPCLAKILSSTFSAQPCYIFFKEENQIIGIIQGCLKKEKFYSLPIFPTSGIYTRNESTKSALYGELINKFKKFQIRDFICISDHFDDRKVTHYLNLLSTKEEQINFYKAKLRSQINKAIKNGLCCEVGGFSYLNVFYSLYAQNMHSLGVPVMEKKFFKSIFQNYENGDCFIFLIKYNEIIIAASFILTYGKFFEVGWASSLKKYNQLGSNMLLYHEMIMKAIDWGYELFSFGRCTINSPTYDFKKQWQGYFKTIFYNYDIKKNDAIKKYTFFRKIYSHSPYFLTGKIISKLRNYLIDYT